MHTTLQILDVVQNIQAAGSITDMANNKITAWTSISKIGGPLVIGLVCLFLAVRAGLKFGKTIGLVVVGAVVGYMTIGGGMQDLGNMGKAEINSSGPVIIQQLPADPLGSGYDG